MTTETISPATPWWHGRCREIAEQTNFMSNHPNVDLTPFQVECVMMTIEGINKREGRVTVPRKMVYLEIPWPKASRAVEIAIGVVVAALLLIILKMAFG